MDLLKDVAEEARAYARKSAEMAAHVIRKDPSTIARGIADRFRKLVSDYDDEIISDEEFRAGCKEQSAKLIRLSLLSDDLDEKAKYRLMAGRLLANAVLVTVTGAVGKPETPEDVPDTTPDTPEEPETPEDAPPE